MEIYVYSDESGVFDKAHNDIFVFGGIVFLSKEDKEVETRKYSNVERVIRKNGNYKSELKASTVSIKDKQKLYRSLNGCYKFGAVIDQQRVLAPIWEDKKDKQRYLDYAYKIGVKRLFQRLIQDGVIDPHSVRCLYFNIDEHTTATNGKYELRESLEQEFKRGVYNYENNWRIPPIFTDLQHVGLTHCNSETARMIRAADIIANNIYHKATHGKPIRPYDGEANRLLITRLP